MQSHNAHFEPVSPIAFFGAGLGKKYVGSGVAFLFSSDLTSEALGSRLGLPFPNGWVFCNLLLS